MAEDGLQIKITADGTQAEKELANLSNAMSGLSDKEINVNLQNLQNIGTDIGKNIATSLKIDALSAITDFGSKLENTFGSIFKGIVGVAQKLSGVLSGIARNAFAIGGGFEASMTSVKIISGATAEELEKLTAQAREMGATMPITAKDAADAMVIMAQRGTQAVNIMANVKDVAALAISQGVDMASAADLLGSTMQNFGLSVDNATRITNLFNNASNQSALNISKIREAMKYAAPAAAAVGYSLEDTLAALEILANSGLPGMMSGTGYSMVLSKLAKNTRVLGVETKTINGELRPLEDIFTELAAKGFTLADASRLFGERGAKAALNLVKNVGNLNTFRERLEQMGATTNAVNEKMKTFPNVMNAFRSATEELHIEIFEQIKIKSKDVVSNIADLTRVFSNWIKETDIAGKSFQAFLKGLGFEIPGVEDFRKMLDEFNIEAFLKKVEDFGVTTHDIANSIVNFFGLVKTPLLFLIEHLDSLAKISFWGWILGKGLQIPAAIMGIAVAFKALGGSLAVVGTALGTTMPALTALSKLSWDFSHNGFWEQLDAYQQIADAQEKVAEFQEKNANDTPKFLTGFEDASQEIEATKNSLLDINSVLEELQVTFKNKVFTAIQSVNSELENLDESFTGTVEDITDELATQLTNALQGNKTEFEKLPDYWKAVVDKLVDMGVAAGKAQGDVKELIQSYKALKTEVAAIPESSTNDTSEIKQPTFKYWTQDLSNEIQRILQYDIPDGVARIKEFLGEQDLELNISFNLEEVRKQLKANKGFIKTTAEYYGLSEGLVENAVIDKFKQFAAQGNKYAQAMVNGWKGAKDEISDFTSKANEAIKYFSAAPTQFMPTLNKLASGIQKIDPITGKLTESFKQVYETLKSWNDITFDKISKRIQALRKAYEGGFVDKKAVESEFKQLSEQLKLKIVTELEPTRSEYKDQKAYEGVVASEYFAKIGEIGGEIMLEQAKKEFDNPYAWNNIGEIILKQVSSGIGKSSSTFKLNGVDIQREGIKANEGTFQIDGLTQAFTNSFAPFMTRLEQVSENFYKSQPEIKISGISESIMSGIAPFVTKLEEVKQVSPVLDVQNFSSVVSEIVTAIRTVSTDVGEVRTAVNAVETAIKSQSQASVSLDSSTISQAVSSSISPIVTLLSQQQNTLQTETTTIESVIKSIEAIKTTIENNNDSETIDFSPVISALNEIRNVLNTMDAGNNYNIDINQQGFVIQEKNDADRLARATINALKTGLGNGGS